MAELEQLEALRRRNKNLLQKLKKQTEKLQQLKLSRLDEEVACQSSVREELTGRSDRRRASLTETNGQPTASIASPSKAKTPPQSIKTPDEGFDGDSEAPIPDLHQHNPSSALTAYDNLLLNTGNSRLQGHKRTIRILPKSALLTQDKKKREVDSALTLSPGLENERQTERQRIRPLLGYDWIAGLLDAESSLTERSEHFFSELRSFRQFNRDECIHSSLIEPPLVAGLESSALEGGGPLQPPDKHQCTFCYRINGRLFAAPLDPQAACPVCKMPKSEHRNTETEPAFIRVSIPRSTLLPSYKYTAHRRSSFDPSDSLGLPSHCLSGWSNPALNSGHQMSSLDLRGSMAKLAAASTSTPSSSNSKLDSSLSKKSRNQHSNLLLKVSCFP